MKRSLPALGALSFAVASLAFALPVRAATYSDNTPTARRMTQALNILEARGDGAFSNFHATAGNDFTAQVTENGRQVAVTVDPATSQVTNAS